MLSSRRSSRSHSSLRPQTWRAHNSPKNSAQPSVSLVFAEPEQAIPLVPAQVLVSRQVDTLSIHSTDDASPSCRNLTSKPSIASLSQPQPLGQGSAEPDASPVPDPSTNQEDDQSSEQPDNVGPTSSPGNNINALAEPSPSVLSHDLDASPPSATPPVPSPTKHSWFRTFRRVKSGHTSSRINIVQTLSAPQLDHITDTPPGVSMSPGNASFTSLPPSHFQTDTAEYSTPTLPLSPPDPNALIAQATRNSSNPLSPAEPTGSVPKGAGQTLLEERNVSTEPPSESPATLLCSPSFNPEENNLPVGLKTRVSPSSEEIPVIDLSQDLPPMSSVVVAPNTESGFSASNSSSSRFSLAIPFFGRSKLPIESLSKTDEKDCKVEPLTQPVNTNAHDLSLPLPNIIESSADAAAGDSSQNSEEMEHHPDNDQCAPTLPQLPPNVDNVEGTPILIQSHPSNTTWWSYLSWSTPRNPDSSFSPHDTGASTSNPPSGLQKSDESRSDTGITNTSPPLSPMSVITATERDTSVNPPTTGPETNPRNNSSTTVRIATDHASETREILSTKPTIPSSNNIFNAIEPETLPRSPDSQERDSEEAQQQQIESAEQPDARTPSDSNVPPSTSWLAPWSWYSPSNNQVTVGPSITQDNGCPKMEMGSQNDPAGVRLGQEHELRDDTDGTADIGKRTTQESDGETQAVVESKQRQNLGEQSEGEKGNAGVANVTDTTAEVTVSSDQIVNPIEQSITTYRSGWASFFSSRRLMVKTLGYGSTPPTAAEPGEMERDENGMEVMEVDFDEDAMSADKLDDQDQKSKQPSDRTTKNGTMEGDAKSVDGVKPVVGASSSGSSRHGSEKPKPQNHSTTTPLTTSEDLKQKIVQSEPTNVKKGQSAPSSRPGSGSTTPITRPLTPTGKGDSDPSTSSSTTILPAARKRTASPAPPSSSKKAPPPPNLVLPTWEDTFHAPPRNVVLPSAAPTQAEDQRASTKFLGRALGFVSDVLFSTDCTNPYLGNKSRFRGSADEEDQVDESLSLADRERIESVQHFGKELPQAWDLIDRTMGDPMTREHKPGTPPKPHKQSSSYTPWRFMSMERDTDKDGVLGPGEQAQVRDVLRGCRRVVVIGIHGWFPGAVVRTVLGEPTGTSAKFVNMMVQALESFQQEHTVFLEKITQIPLEGEGTIDRRVDKLYNNLTSNEEWMNDLHDADAIFVATHSQGSVVSTHLLNRLIQDQHIYTSKNQASSSVENPGPSIQAPHKCQRVCCLALCGIHMGPLRYLNSSSFVQPYLQYFESSAARELFEFQNTESAVSKSYVNALRHILDNGVKMVYVASLNDQVVPIYSGLFTAISHPLILRALYIDGDAYHSSDFLSNLLVLLLRILNSGISDSGLLVHLSEATAGSLSGVGHSTAYEEISTYTLAVKYLFLTNDGFTDHSRATVESFNTSQERNDYEIPWALRDLIANEKVLHFFNQEVATLRDAFRDWHPRTSILRDLKRKLQPIQRLPPTFYHPSSTSKL